VKALERAVALEQEGRDWDDPEYVRTRNAVLSHTPRSELFDELMARLDGQPPEVVCLSLQLLGQLGAADGDSTWQQKALPTFIELVEADDIDVATAAVHALGHAATAGVRWDAAVLRSAAADDDEVLRHAVAAALGSGGLCDVDPEAVRLMLFLAVDPDPDVRSWAIFGLGSQSQSDSELLRETFRKAAQDDEPEIRGEALVALARRKDPEAQALILAELTAEETTVLAIEAAEALADPALVEALEGLKALWPEERATIEAALAACTASR